MHLSPIPGGILIDFRAAAVLSSLFLLGGHEKEGDVRGKIIPGRHRARLHTLAANYGAAVRLGEGRKIRNTYHSQRSCEGKFGSRRNFCPAAEGRSMAFISL